MEFFTFVNVAEYFGMLGHDEFKQYFWMYFVVAAAIFGILYVFQGVALFTIGKREGYGKCWMAFVPFLNLYYMGVVSQKNKPFRGMTSKQMGIIVASLSALVVALNILYYVAEYLLIKNGCIYFEEVVNPYYGSLKISLGQFVTKYVPDNLKWAEWIYLRLDRYILQWVELLYMLAEVFLIISFFRTYSTRRYVLFSIFSIIFPIRPIFMFAVRNNRGKSYADYVREQQQRQYQAYQNYMRNNPPPTGGNSYYGNNQPPQPPQPHVPEDPFGGLGQSGGDKRDDDPFGDM